MDRGGSNWFEAESFWAKMFPFMFPDSAFVAATENVPKIAALTGVSGGKVLDLACGPGRYAIPLAQAGFNVTGVDRTRFLLDSARERATRAGTDVEWVEQDMRDFIRPAAFDLAMNVFTSFGYFDDEAENLRVLENIYASLKPGGVFLFDHLGKEVLAARYKPTRSDSLLDGTLLIHRTSVIDDWSRISDEWILLEGTKTSTYCIRHWIYSGREIRELLAKVGFGDVSLHGTLEGTPYDPRAQRLIAVARKPHS